MMKINIFVRKKNGLLCCVFSFWWFVRLVSCVPNVGSVTKLSILDCPSVSLTCIYKCNNIDDI